MTEVPGWWVWVSGLYFVVSIIWSAALVAGMIMLYKKAMPVISEARLQVKQVCGQAQSIAAKASSTAELVHVTTQHFLEDAQIAGNSMTRQARTVGATISALLVAGQVVKFVRKTIQKMKRAAG